MAKRALDSQVDELHKKAKWYYSYDLYTDNTFGLQVQDDVRSFDDFRGWIHPVLTSKKRKNIPFLKIVGNRRMDKVCTVSTEESRKFVRSLIKAVQENMRDGHCFANFNKSNIVLTHTGEVRFKNIAVVPKNGPAKTITYNNTISVIAELFGEDTPPDLKHIIDLMEKQSKEKHQEKEEL